MIRTFLSELRQAVRRPRRGFSLIEVNMAIFVLAGGALALLGLFPLGLRYSQQANAEMRTTAFAQRFLGAARVVAMSPDVRDENDLANAISSEFGINVSVGIGEEHETGGIYEDTFSNVFYRAWVAEDSTGDVDLSDTCKRVVEAGIQVTTENWRQNKYAFVGRPISVIKLVLNGAGDETN